MDNKKVMDNWKDTNGLFKPINKLVNNNKDNPLQNRPPEVLAEKFATYFLEKNRNNIGEVQQHKASSTRNQGCTTIQKFCSTYKQASVQNHNVDKIQVPQTEYSTNTCTQENITSMPKLNNHHRKFITDHGRIRWRMENSYHATTAKEDQTWPYK